MGTLRSPRIKIQLSLIVIVFLWHQSLAGTCKEGCPAASQTSKYKFSPGQVYNYNLDSQVVIYLSGSKQQTQVNVVGVVELYFAGNCQYYLYLHKLQISSPGDTKVSSTKDLQKPVKFILSNDELSPEICADASDTEFSLNIKRAIISLIQSSEGKSHETDIFGVCPTTVLRSDLGDSVIITKTRDLNTCAHREFLSDGFIKGVLNEASGVKSTPILNGDYTMEQKIKNGILDSVTLTEQYMYLPFSTQTTGVRAKVITKLSFVDTAAKEAPQPQKPKERTLLYKNFRTTTTTNPENAKNLLKKTVESYDSVSKGVGKETASEFADLVKALRKSKKDDLLRMYDDIKKGVYKMDKELTRKVYLDALFRAGSANSVSAISDMMKKELSEKEQRLAYLSFNLVQTVSKEALALATKTIGPTSTREAFMGLGTLIKKYCSDRVCGPTDVKDIYQKFANNLGSCKPTNRAQEDKIVAVLKAIRNAGVLFDPVTKKMEICLADGPSARIRVAALQAIGSTTCAKNMQSKVLSVLKNRVEDSEVRIEAYLALLNCPSANLANDIKSLLDDEPIYQVGSFITSHLRNIHVSADPHRESLRRIFGNIRLPHRFPVDIRKYSFNREISYTIDSLGLGASVDKNVIYSQKGFLPRSASLNLTGELFGNIFNVLELNVRQENMEHVMEHYFGPKGELKTSNFQEMFNSALESYNSIVEGTKKRFKRAITKDASDSFTNAISYQNEVFSDVEMDLSVKLFGTELYFLSIADDVPSSPKEFIASLFKVLDQNMVDAKNFNKVYEHHVLFLDTDLVYPSGIGLPLKLGVQGVAAARVEVGSNTDFKQFKTAPAFNIKVMPSFNIDVSGTLLVDALIVQAGVKLEGNMHSSTGSEVTFKLSEDKKIMDLKFGFPFRNQEIISFKTNALFVVFDAEKGNVELPVVAEGTQKNRKFFSDCFDQFVPLIGINVCPSYELNMGDGPNSLSFPFAGPNHVSLRVELEPEFTVQGRLDDSKPKNKVLTYVFDTPGSTENRRTQLQFELGYDTDYFARIALDNPRKKASVEAGVKRNDKEFALYAQGTHDQNEYLAKFGFNVQGNQAHAEYTPIIILKGPKDQADHVAGYKVDGKIIADRQPPNAKYTFNNIKVTTPTNNNFLVNGFISHDGTNVQYDMTYTQESDQKKANIKGGFGYKEKERLLVDIAFTNDFNNQLNGQFKYEYDHKPGTSCKNDLLVAYGTDPATTKNRLRFTQNSQYSKDENESFKTLKGQLKFEAPFIPLVVNLEHDYHQNFVQFNFDLQSEPNKMNVYTTNKYNTKAQGDYDIEVGGTFNKHTAKFTGVRVVGDKVSDHKYRIESNCGFEFDLNGKFSNSIDIENLSADFEAKTVCPKISAEPYMLKFFLQSTPTTFKSNANMLEGSKTLATYSAEGTRGDTTSAKFNVDIVDILNGEGNLQSINGKGTFTTLIAFKKIDRKIKIESGFTIAQPTYDMNTKFFYDYEKDNGKKIEFTTKSSISTDNVDTKNILLILTQKYTFNFHQKSEGSKLNGNLNGGFEFGLPNGRIITSNYDRHRELKDDKVNAKVKIEIYDQLPTGSKRSLVMDTILKDVDMKQRLMDINHKMTYNNFENKDVTMNFNVVRVRSNKNTKVVNMGFKLESAFISQPVSMTLSGEDDDHLQTMIISAKYGNQFDFDLNAKYDIHQDDDKPTTHDLTFTINAPETEVKTIKVMSAGSFKEPENDDGMYECTHRGSITFGAKTMSVDNSFKMNFNKGDIKLVMNLPDFDPINVKLNYNRQHESNDVEKAHVDFDMVYGKNQKVNFKADSTVSSTEIIWRSTLESPIESAKQIGLDFDWNFTGGNKYSSGFKVDIDGRSYLSKAVIVISEAAPVVSVEFIYPEKTIKFYLAVQKLEDFKYTAQVKIENLMTYNLDMNAETLFRSPENFYLKVNLDSTNLKQVNVEISSKAGGKGVEFKGTKEGKNLISGSADFQVKEDQGKTIIEGNGNIKWYEDTQATTFKFIRNKFDAVKDKETGVSFVFDGRLGNKNIISELKLTDRNVALKHTVCEAKKQCVNIDLRSTLQKSDINDFKHELLISIDLRELGYSHEFGLKADTSKQGMTFDHTVDMHLQSQDKNKYQYSLYIHKNSAGITLTLPTRTISLEGTYVYPTDQIFGKYESGVYFYLDKANNPGGKTSLAFIGNLDRSGKNVFKGKGDLRLEHPAIKALVVSGLTTVDADSQKVNAKMTFDVFQQENKKIISQFSFENSDRSGKGFNVTTDLKINSKGLQMDLEFDNHAALNYDTRTLSVGSNAIFPRRDFSHSTYMFINEKTFELYFKLFNEELMKVSGSYDADTRSANYNSVFKQFASTPLVITGQSNGMSSATVTMTKGALVNVQGQFDLGKEASVNVVGDGKQLFNGKLALDDAQFLATNFNVQEENIKTFLKKLEEVVKTENEASRQAYVTKFEEAKNAFVTQYKEITGSFPDFTQLKQDYQKQWDKFKTELQSDPTIKKVADGMVETIAAITKVIDEITKHMLEFYEKISKIVTDFAAQMKELFDTKLMPIIKDLYTQVETLGYKVYEEFVSMLAGFFENIAKALKGFEEDFNKVSSAIAGLFKNVSLYFKEYIETFDKEMRDFYKLLLSQFEQIPGLDVIQTKISEFFAQYALGDHVAALMKELLDLVKDHLPTEESKEFIRKLSDYIQAKLMHQTVSDTDSFKDLFESLINAVRSMFKMLTQGQKETDVSGWFGSVPVSFEAFKRMSYAWNIKSSVFRCLRDPGCISIRNLLVYRPYAFEFGELFVPFSLHAHVADGEHIFTFDGRHMTFPGSCNYVLAHDAYEKNFTLVANLVNGKLDSLTLFDKGDSVEITKSGIVNLNGAPTELPTHKNDIHVWRRYYSISLLTTYGLNVLCTTDLRICHVTVSGYYHGRLRGLLGNGNYEPYDDLMTPAGTVVESDVAFGNEYKMDQSCQAVAPVTHSHKTDDTCSQLFGSGSPLRLCYFMVDQKNFKEACTHAVETAQNKEDAACNIAFLYASACRLENIPVMIPDRCAKCKVEKREIPIGDDFNVKLPAKQADAVIVVDTAVSSVSDLIDGIVADLRKEFTSRQITDVRVSVIGFSKEHKYTSLFTTNGGYDFSGKFPPVELNGPQVDKPVKTGDTKFDDFSERLFILTEKLRADLGLSAAAEAVKMALDYPFRPEASKTILFVKSESYSEASPAIIANLGLAQGVADVQGIFIHTLLPLDGLTIGGGVDPKRVVGFSEKNVYMLIDGRKRPEGSPELREKIDFKNQNTLEFALQFNGMIFALQNYEALEPKQRAQFSQTLSAAIADQISRTEQELECTCIVKHSLYAEPICYVKDDKIRPPVKRG